MDDSPRRIVLDVAKGDADGKPTVAQVSFCESSASLQIGDLTAHLPWSELAQWQVWLAARVEQEV
jgi:hypothetical protein